MKQNTFEQALKNIDRFDTPIGVVDATIEVSDTMDTFARFFESQGVQYTAGDLVQAARLMLERKDKAASEILEGPDDNGGYSESDNETASVINLVCCRNGQYTARTLAQALRRRAPFRRLGKSAYSRARSRIDSMLSDGTLTIDGNGMIRI